MNENELIYGEKFFRGQRDGSYNSAKEILSILLKQIEPVKILDVGCGVGTWLKVLMENGIKEVVGIDGEWVLNQEMQIPKENFIAQDFYKKIEIEDKYDLILCLELLEHLPDELGRKIIKEMTKKSPLILFSAAVPGQTGALHINEQWQSYWAGLFRKEGFFPFDIIRSVVWNNPKVEYWYAQNTLLYMNKAQYKKFEKNISMTPPKILNLVHPMAFINANKPRR